MDEWEGRNGRRKEGGKVRKEEKFMSSCPRKIQKLNTVGFGGKEMGSEAHAMVRWKCILRENKLQCASWIANYKPITSCCKSLE